MVHFWPVYISSNSGQIASSLGILRLKLIQSAPSTVEQLQDLLASWARDLEFSAAEQGYGALRLGKLPYQTDKILKRESG